MGRSRKMPAKRSTTERQPALKIISISYSWLASFDSYYILLMSQLYQHWQKMQMKINFNCTWILLGGHVGASLQSCKVGTAKGTLLPGPVSKLSPSFLLFSPASSNFSPGRQEPLPRPWRSFRLRLKTHLKHTPARVPTASIFCVCWVCGSSYFFSFSSLLHNSSNMFSNGLEFGF